MSFETLILDKSGYVATIKINRPAALNALNRQVLAELLRALRELDGQKDILATIITGDGEKSFVAGADIAEMKGLSPIEAEKFSAFGHEVFDFIGQMRMPAIAAINGFALGGGLELALACDFIYASENALLGLVETSLGLIPGFGGVARLSRRVGSAMAAEMIFGALRLDAREAHRIGLVNKVVLPGEVLDYALSAAQKIAKCGPVAVSRVKSLLRESCDQTVDGANALEKRSFGLMFSSSDSQEGIAAFLEKRKPNFKGA